ncbi:MAG: DUF2247 family protein [Ruminococcus sp.]|nr:DUF2247 family protein [Ruminococcus sp.]
MIRLDEFRNLGFSITWKLISIGYISNSVFSNKLMIDDIIDYAVNLYENEISNELLLNLIVQEKDNSQNILNIINELSDKEKSNYFIEYKKWEILFVWKKISMSNQNYIDFLLELSDLWTELGCPKDFPPVVQGVSNIINPTDYYSLKNYNIVIKELKQWIFHEIKTINSDNN